MAGTDKARQAALAQAAQTKAAPDKAGQPTVADLLEKLKPQIARALPKQMDSDRFARIVMTTLRRTPKLMECDPQSLMAACMLSAQLGLEPGPLGHAWLIPYKREVTFVLGYRGIIELARRSGEIVSIEAREVREADEFEFAYGLDARLHHVPALGDRGKPLYYWGLAKFKDGGHYFEVLSMDDIERHRASSAAKNSGPWVDHYSAMARKTCIRSMAPYLPLSPEAARAVDADDGVVANLPLDADEVEVRHDDVIRVEATVRNDEGDGEGGEG